MRDGDDGINYRPDVDLGGAGDVGNRALDDLQDRLSKRLESLGASSEPSPPPAAPPQRLSSFAKSDSSAGREEAEERLKRMRQKDLGELEEPNANEIERARRSAKQWQNAGLHERAYADLQRVEKFLSYSSATGASFHLDLADAVEACGRSAEARRMRQRVMAEAKASSQRWQAEQSLNGASPSASTSSSPSNPELNRLWNMPNQWD